MGPWGSNIEEANTPIVLQVDVNIWWANIQYFFEIRYLSTRMEIFLSGNFLQSVLKLERHWSCGKVMEL